MCLLQCIFDSDTDYQDLFFQILFCRVLSIKCNMYEYALWWNIYIVYKSAYI